MKRMLLSLIIGFLFINNSEAYETQVNFDSHSAGRFILFVNGQKMNHRPARQLRLNHLPAGKNNLKVRYWNNGVSCDVWQTIYLKPGYETSFKIKTGTYKIYNDYRPPYHKPVDRYRNGGNFKNFISQLEGRRFDDKKLAFASNYLSRNDLSTRQLIRILRQFSFDDTKINFIVYAHKHIYDQENFYLVYDELRFRSSIRTVKSKLGLGGRGRRYGNNW